MDKLVAIAAVLLAGALIAAQAPANELLSRHVSDLGAAFVSLLLSAALIGALLVIAGDPAQLRHIDEYRPVHAIAAVAGAAIVAVGLVAVRQLGAAGVTALTVAGQLTVSVIIDQYGWLGVDERPIDLQALAGIVLLAGGTALVTLR